MSVQLGLWDSGAGGSESRLGADEFRASLAREMRYLLARSCDAGGSLSMRPTGIAHAFGVCLIEDSNMARGGKKGPKDAGSTNLPRFVDVKLSTVERAEFAAWEYRNGDLVAFLQSLADDGYRVGVSWSGEQQAYTVSLTCRNSESVNAGLCMTSFAKTLSTALWLALYKHLVVTEEHWLDGSGLDGEEFG